MARQQINSQITSKKCSNISKANLKTNWIEPNALKLWITPHYHSNSEGQAGKQSSSSHYDAQCVKGDIQNI